MQTELRQRNHISYRGDFSVLRKDSFEVYVLTLKERFSRTISLD